MGPIVRYSLCPDCVACPEVAIYPDRVIIGEEGNQVHLTRQQWERLVAAVRAGELDAPADSCCPDCPPDCYCC